MSESGGFDGEYDLPGGSFSRLLLSSDDTERSSTFHVHSTPAAHPNAMFSTTTPKMLCFGDFGYETTPISSTLTYTDTSSPSSSGNNTISLLNSSYSNNKRRNGSGQEAGQGSEKSGKKKNKQEIGQMIDTPVRHAKVRGRREKLGERITALQQLVCPYGKTDTASVLHEAMGYIRFLHDQVKVLSSPYLQRLPTSSSPCQPLYVTENGVTITQGKDSVKGLRTRGLCLVPVECIIDLANSNGADFWSSLTSLSTP